jgi:nucleoside-diphosphate-sugar epimerase
MRILVTGAAGFIGSHVCERLIDDGYEVIGIDAFVGSYGAPLKERNLQRLREAQQFTFHQVDLRTDDLDRLTNGCDAIVNEAAMAGLAPSWADLDLYASSNLIGLGRLIESARRAGVSRFIQASTSSVYGTNAVGDESLPTRPSSPYGVTKLAAENLLLAHVEAFGFPAVILRYFSIYGPRQRPDMAYHRFIEAMFDGRPITVYGDGEQSRSNTYVDDCVEATVRALQAGDAGEIYNVGGGESITVNQAIATIAAITDTEPVIRYQPRLVGDQRHTRADTTKAQRVLGYRPSIAPADGLRRQVAWHGALRGSS